MKRANGNGSVVKLKGKRRRPFCARITVWTDTGSERRQERKAIGYFKTRPEAEAALYKYCQGFVEVPDRAIPTFAECFTKAMETVARTAKKNTISSYQYAFKKLEDLHRVRIDRITPLMLQEQIDQIAVDYRMSAIKAVINAANHAFDYAMRMRYISEKPTASLDFSAVSNEKRRERRIFSPSEIETLRRSNEAMAKMVLIMIYTGMRRGEAIDLKLSDIDMTERLIRIRQSKTAAGVRIIPIAGQIYDAVQDLYLRSRSGYLFEHNGRKYSITRFAESFTALMDKLGMDHIPHETRHTFATLLYNAHVDDVATKAIIGHTDIKLTHDVYTHESIDNLRDAISRLN